MEESGLISKAENYLSEIAKDEIVLDNINDFEYFKSLYSKLNCQLEYLQKLKDSMDSQGYTSPFRSLNKYGTGTVGEVSLEELSENSRHNQLFRMRANAKKNILGRVKSAINSHKIAIGNLSKYANIKCENCYKSYDIDKYREINGECKGEINGKPCNSKNFSFKTNKDLTHRLEIIPYLPLSGNYMVLMTEFSDWGREAFKKVLNFLKQERKGHVKTISLVIKFKDGNNRWIHKNINLGSEYIDNYEEEIRNRYGKNVRIEMLRFHRTKPAIIDDKYTRTALAIAYVKYAEKLVNEIKDSIFKKNISDFKRLNKYDEVIFKYNTETPIFIEKHDQEGLELWRQGEIEKEFKKLGYIDKYGKLNRSLKRDLKNRDNIEKTIFTNIPIVLIMWDIFRYYLSTSQYNRTRMKVMKKKTSDFDVGTSQDNDDSKVYIPNPFPHLRVDLDRQQRKVFQTTYNKVIQTLNEETDLKIITIENMDFILYEKFNLEKLIVESNFKCYYPALGPALISLNSDIDIETLGNIFNVNSSKINKEIDNIKKLKEPKSNKSKKFLELIK